MSTYALIAISAILSSNIVAVGVGAVSLQSEKRNFIFMLTTTLCQILSIFVVGILYNVIEIYVLVPLKAEYLKLFIVVCLSCVCAFLSKYAVKAISKEQFFYFEKSYTLPVQSAVTAGTMFLVSFSSSIVDTLYTLAMFSVGYLLVQVIFYSLYERLDNTYALKAARNVPLMLYTLSALCMIFYAVSAMLV